MKSNIIICLIFSLLISSCKENKSKNDNNEFENINIDISKTKPMNISDEYKLNKYIVLETKSESLLKNIEKIFISDSLIIIFDNKMNDILLFHNNGKFERVLGRKGNGPHEHIVFQDVFFHKDSGFIYALEPVKQIMFIYNLSGELIREISTNKFMFRSFCKVEDGYWIYSCYKTGNPNKYSIMKVDNNFEKMICGYLPQKDFFRTTIHSTFIQNSNNENFFISPFGNILYRIVDDNIIPFLKISFRNKTIPYSEIPEISNEDQYKKLVYNHGYLGEMSSFVLNSNSFHFNFQEMANESVLYYASYNLKKKTTDVYDSFLEYKSKLFNDEQYGHITITQPIASYQNKLLYQIKPSDLNEEDLLTLNNTMKVPINTESNPILLLMENNENN